ncbi:MAG TPA: hypothetical protein EYP56_10575 [Planctomycetaceae bacterium]|nr:hypothetical protein [Planctomycetaceae bacterium]
MTGKLERTGGRISRRSFHRRAGAGGLAAGAASWLWAAGAGRGASRQARLAFRASGNEFPFDTGLLRGVLRSEGRSHGLGPVVYVPSGKHIARGFGLFSHYRLLDDRARYGRAAWDWAGRARLAEDGSVEVFWPADSEHPFQMRAVYRWSAPNTLDLQTTVVARRQLRRFEVFLASYFQGFGRSLVYVVGSPEAGARFLEVERAAGVWQMFPRDEAAVAIIRDGRWRRPPNPVQWQIMPRLAAPLAVRRDPPSGLAGVVMAPPDDCFAVATPYGQEPHRSLYLSLLGRRLEPDRPATARARLVIGQGISDAQVVALYEAYVAGLRSSGR